MSNTYWNCADGRKIAVSDMTDLHVFNTLQMLFRRLDLPLKDMPESIDKARVYLVNYIKNKEKRSKFIPRYFGRYHNDEPWDDFEGCWEDCH